MQGGLRSTNIAGDTKVREAVKGVEDVLLVGAVLGEADEAHERQVGLAVGNVKERRLHAVVEAHSFCTWVCLAASVACVLKDANGDLAER